MKGKEHSKAQGSREQKKEQFTSAAKGRTSLKLWIVVVVLVAAAAYLAVGAINKDSATEMAKATAIQTAPGTGDILADEPTGTLDTRTGEEIMKVFLTLNAQGQTVFLVTHNPENAALAHRIINIRDGRMVADERTAPRLIEAAAPAVQVGV